MTIFAYKFMSPDYGVGIDLVCLMYSSNDTILNNFFLFNLTNSLTSPFSTKIF